MLQCDMLAKCCTHHTASCVITSDICLCTNLRYLTVLQHGDMKQTLWGLNNLIEIICWCQTDNTPLNHMYRKGRCHPLNAILYATMRYRTGRKWHRDITRSDVRLTITWWGCRPIYQQHDRHIITGSACPYISTISNHIIMPINRFLYIWILRLIFPWCCIYASVNHVSIGSDTGLSPIRRLAII